jgi:hypothetical protein
MINLLGYVASCAVLATFLMRTMTPLRLVAILSNVLFLAYGYVEHIYPVFFLHLALLPINSWRLVTLQEKSAAKQSVLPRAITTSADTSPHAVWFLIGLLAGSGGLLVAIVMEKGGHI